MSIITEEAQKRVDSLLLEIANCPGFRFDRIEPRGDGGALIYLHVSALRRNFLPTFDASGQMLAPVPNPEHIINVSPEGVRE